MIAECPHLVVDIHQGSHHFALASPDLVMTAFVGSDVVSEESLSQGRNPHIVVVINREIRDDGSNLIAQLLKLLRFKIEEEGTLGCTHQQSLVAGFQCTYILVELHLRVIEILHMIAIIPAETVIGTKPDESILILHDASHGIARQSRVHRDGTHQRLPHYVSAPGRSRRHRHQEDGS